jgi:hypothetical protein
MTCSQNQNTNGPCPQYSSNSSTNQISNSGYTYDASGDLTGDGVHTYQYDAEGRLVSVDGGSTATYVYNALGERVDKDVSGTYTEYVFDKDGDPVGENNRTTWTDTWAIFNGQHVAHYENGVTYFMQANSVGTIAFVTDYTGVVVQDELAVPAATKRCNAMRSAWPVAPFLRFLIGGPDIEDQERPHSYRGTEVRRSGQRRAVPGSGSGRQAFP